MTTSAGEIGQAKDRTPVGHGRYDIDRYRRGRPEQYGRHAQKYDELGKI